MRCTSNWTCEWLIHWRRFSILGRYSAWDMPMTNPYESPVAIDIKADRLFKTKRKLRIATVCLVLSGLFWIAGVAFLVISFDRTKLNLSAFDRIAPFFIAAYSLVALSLFASAWGLAARKKWAVLTGICSLVFSGFSILFPVTCVGIWALTDSKIKYCFNSQRT